jgi:hypothetical protein
LLTEEELDEIGLILLLKNAYGLNPHTGEELKENIQREVYSQQELQHMNVNFLWRCQECVQNNRDHFQLLL